MYTNQSQLLTVKDCSLLAVLFEQEVRRLFPVPAAVCLWYGPTNFSSSEYPDLPARIRRLLLNTDQSIVPGYSAGALFCPLLLAGGQEVIFVLYDADPAILKKFSSDWLKSFQAMVYKHLKVVRQVYIDPQTGLYNSRALDCFLGSVSDGNDRNALYLISLHFIRRANKGIFRKVRYLSRLLSATDNKALFFLGQGLFGLVVECSGKRQRLVYAHQLQKYLKRKGLQKVHVAFSSMKLEKDKKYTLAKDLLEVLAVAERRGPFGLCDADDVREDAYHPFSLPEKKVLKKLRSLWRGKDKFTLALFFRDVHGKNSQALSTILAPVLSEQEQCVAVDKDLVFVFFNEPVPSRHSSRVKEIAACLQTSGASVSAGICEYPCLNFTKTDMVRNCRKALLHGSFYESSRVVAFDHVSLNISGDRYFDEGDFRQAVREYSQGLQLCPGEKNLLNSLGVALMEMNRIHDAIESFIQVLEQEPDNHMALVNLGYAYQQQGNDFVALEHFEKACTVHYHSGMDGIDIYRQLSRLYCRMGRYQEALPILDRWRQDMKSDGQLLLHRLSGEAYAETGQKVKAMKALQRALQLHPNDVESMGMLGLLYVEQGEGEEAGFLLLEKALSLDGAECDSWYRYARALVSAGREKEALTAVGRSLRLSRTHVKAMLLHAGILAALAKTKQARKVLDRLIKRKDVPTPEKREAEHLLTALVEST